MIPWFVLFWLAFIIFLFGLYLFNRETINKSIGIVQREVFYRDVPGGPARETPTEPSVIQVPPPVQTLPGTTAAAPSTPVETPSATAPSQTEPQDVPSQTEQSQQVEQGTEVVQGTGAVQSTAELRDRTLYFINIDGNGSALRVRADRRLPASDSPLRDAIEALIAGPNAEERQRGLVSLIPAGTNLLSITIRGETAYINFSEDFQYNSYGVEGYDGQLRQVVFTATEFPTVRDVQILIEGRRVDFLSENVWVGSPLSREMFQG